MAIGLSILEQEDALKGLPTQALQQMMRQPSPDAPPFLVAAELKRRETMANEFSAKQAAAQTAQDAPTVAHRLAGQQQAMPMSQAGAMAAPPQQPPMPKEAQLAMALSGATGQPPPQLPTVNMQRGTSGAAMREMAKALRGEGTRSYTQRRGHQPFSSRERPPPVTPAGLALLLAAMQRQQSEPERAYGGFDISEDIRLPQGRGRTVAAARPVTAANGTQGRTVYAQFGLSDIAQDYQLLQSLRQPTWGADQYDARGMAKEGSDREKFNIAMNSVLEKYGGSKEFDKALRLAGIVGGDADRATPRPPPAAPPLRVPWNFPTNLRAEAESFENIPQRTFPESEWPEMTDAEGAAFAAALGEGLGAPERVPTQRAATEVEPVPQEFQGAPGPQVDADVMDFEFGGGEFRPAEGAVPEIVAPRTSPPRRGNIPNPRFTEAELFPASDPVEQDGQSGTGAEVLSDLLIPADFAGSEAIPDEVYGAGLGVLSGPAGRRVPVADQEELVAPQVDSGILAPVLFEDPASRKFRAGPQTEMLIGSLRLNERAEGMPADQLLSEIEQSGRLPEGFDGKGIDPQILRRANLQALLAVQEARAPGLEIDVAQRKAALSRELVEPGTLRPDERARLAAEDQPQVDRGYKNNPEKPPGTITLAGGSVDGVTGTAVDGDSIQRQIRDALAGVATGPAKKVDATAVAEKARAAGDAMRESLGEKTRTLIDQQDASIDKIAKADKAGLKKISDSMTALKDFQETGRLPKKHRDALINAGLMEFGAALLDPNNPTLYGAFSAGLRGFQKIEKGKRKEYLEGLKYALTAETAQQEMAMKIRNSEAVARRSLAQFQIAQQSRDETAAAAAEKRYTDATNDARRFEIMERTAATGKLSALATILNAIKPDKDARMFNMLLKGKLEEAKALAEQGDVKLLNEAFIYDEKTHKATPRMGYFIDLFASMDPAAAYRAMAGAQTLGHQQRTEARAVDRIVSAKVEDLTKGWNTSADWLKIHPEKRMPSVAEWQDDKERARLIALARAWVQRRTPGWRPSQGQGGDRLGLIASGSLPSID